MPTLLLMRRGLEKKAKWGRSVWGAAHREVRDASKTASACVHRLPAMLHRPAMLHKLGSLPALAAAALLLGCYHLSLQLWSSAAPPRCTLPAQMPSRHVDLIRTQFKRIIVPFICCQQLSHHIRKSLSILSFVCGCCFSPCQYDHFPLLQPLARTNRQG